MKHIPLGIVVIIASMVLVFQNCGDEGFKAVTGHSESEDLGSLSADELNRTGPFGMPYNEGLTIIGFPSSLPIIDGTSESIEVSVANAAGELQYEWQVAGVMQAEDGSSLALAHTDVDATSGSVITLMVTDLSTGETTSSNLLAHVVDPEGTTGSTGQMAVLQQPIAPAAYIPGGASTVSLFAAIGFGSLDASKATYQWQKAGLWNENYSNVNGQTTNILSLSGPSPSQSGKYRLKISHPDEANNLLTSSVVFKYAYYDVSIGKSTAWKTCAAGYAISGMTYNKPGGDHYLTAFRCRPTKVGKYVLGGGTSLVIDNLSGSYYKRSCGSSGLVTGMYMNAKSSGDLRISYVQCRNYPTAMIGAESGAPGAWALKYNKPQPRNCRGGSFASSVYFDDKGDDGINNFYCRIQN